MTNMCATLFIFSSYLFSYIVYYTDLVDVELLHKLLYKFLDCLLEVWNLLLNIKVK